MAMPAKQGKPLGQGSKYSKKDVMMLYSTFHVFDVNGDGKVHAAEMIERVKAKDLKMPMDHLTFIRALDANHDGVLTFDEVLSKYYPHATAKELQIMYRWACPKAALPGVSPDCTFEPSEAQIKELQDMFNMYDKNKNGVLEWQEVQALTKACGYDEDEVDSLFDAADLNKDSVISFDEFVQLMKDSYIA